MSTIKISPFEDDPGLTEESVAGDPIRQFEIWHEQATHCRSIVEPSAAALATVSTDGYPSVRMVLIRNINHGGFAFFTNYESRKGRDLARDPKAALVLYWDPLHRQVRITGTVHKTTLEESVSYFRTRPRGSQIAAWASPQSTVLRDRAELEKIFDDVEKRFADQEVPLPAHWGGYRLIPFEIEFWQGRPFRLHDRIRYVRQPDLSWRIERLAP